MAKAGIKYGRRIAAPDYARIAEDAEDSVMQALGVKRPEDLVAKPPADLVVAAAEVVRQADAEIAVHIDERDHALAHLWFYEQRLGLAVTAGLTQTGYRMALAKLMFGDKKHLLPDVPTNEELVQAAEEAGIERVDNAEAQLLETAPIVYAARARRNLAVRYMQEAVFALSEPPYKWKPGQIAEHAGVAQHLIYQHRTAARKRRGL
ncbi:hypothetical protein ACFQ6U_13975 [Streptomyces sp. NPDC056465]|uniref:hypothetical protein n=1 Tax=Streptomyces sp. NPDC056465 TaxID=3345829 RepID=UPI0036D040AD